MVIKSSFFKILITEAKYNFCFVSAQLHDVLSSKIYRNLITFFTNQKFILEKYDHDKNQKLQPVGLLKKQCCRCYLPGKIKLFFSVWNTTEFTCFQSPLGKKCFTFNRIFLKTKKGIFPGNSYQRDLFSFVSGKQKTF